MAFIVCILHRHYFAPEPWINNILLHSVCSFNRVEGCNKSVSIFLFILVYSIHTIFSTMQSMLPSVFKMFKRST